VDDSKSNVGFVGAQLFNRFRESVSDLTLLRDTELVVRRADCVGGEDKSADRG
jgi:hypothetical protein